MNIDWKVIISVAESYADSSRPPDYNSEIGWHVESWHGFYMDSVVSQINKLCAPSPTPEQGEKDEAWKRFEQDVDFAVRINSEQSRVIYILAAAQELLKSHAPLPALTTDEEAWKQFEHDLEFALKTISEKNKSLYIRAAAQQLIKTHKSQTPMQLHDIDDNESDKHANDYDDERGYKIAKQAFLAGCKHVRGQQPVDAVAFAEWTSFNKYWLTDVDGKDKWVWEGCLPGQEISSSQLYALFSGSQREDQVSDSEGQKGGGC